MTSSDLPKRIFVCVFPNTFFFWFFDEPNRRFTSKTLDALISRRPGNRICRLPDRRLKTRRKLVSDRDRMLVTAFRSPATAAPRKATIPGSKFPACSFASRRTGSSARSTLSSTTGSRFAPVPAVSPPQARCRIAGSPDLPRFPFPLPVGTFRSVRIKAFHGTRCPSARLPTPPDLRSLPTAGFYY
jgi:hypothetical protein